MEFAQPLWLLLLPVAALPILALRRGPVLPVPESGRVAAPRAAARILAPAPAALRALVLVLLITALARPRTPLAAVEEHRAGVPIVVAIDLSSSMLEESRLEVAKSVLADFIAARPNDPIGLVAFAAEAITLVPLTTHQPLLLGALRTLEIGLLEDGTAIGEGLATAVNRLRRAPGESKVAVLMSDGENNRGTIGPLTAAGAAAALGIRVFTIGLAGEPGASGSAPPDERLLVQIAEMTGGEYHRAGSARTLGQVYRHIDQMARVPIETLRTVHYREWYMWLLAAAAVCLLGEWAVRASRWGALP